LSQKEATDDILLLLPQLSKRGTHFLDKNVRLLEGGEMTAVFGIVPVNEIRIGLLGPASWSTIYLSREDGCGHRQRELAS
jgi:hypothetical protein